MNRKTTRRSDNREFLLLLLAVADSPSVLTCPFNDDAKGITNDRHTGFERLDMNHNYHLWTQKRWEVQITKKCWLLLWAVYDAPSVMTYHFENDTKYIYDDRHTVLSVLIWRIIIIYEQNNYGTFWQRKNVGHSCGPSLMANLSWAEFVDHIIFMMKSGCFCYVWI